MFQANLSVLSNWASMFEHMEVSPRVFYSQVEEAIKKKEIPDLELSRVYHKESGILSADREYLRIERGRYLYDVCAAPFGNGFFFSSWMAEKTPSPVWAIAAFILFIGLAPYVLILLLYLFGFMGFLLWLMGIAGVFVALVVALAREDFWVAEYIFVVPYIGPLLERLCRPNTYFRSDTEAMFRSLAHNAVLEAVDSITKAAGARELTADERKPILRDLFKR